MKEKILSTLLIVAGVGFFAVGGFFLWQKLGDYGQGDDTYMELADIAGSGSNTDGAGDTGSVKVKDKNGDTIEIPDKKIDWESLGDYADNVKGWIYFKDPDRINYPIMQAEDNSYYLHRLYNGEKNSCGSIFMNCDNKGGLTDRNTIIYGHNMHNRSMFGSLQNFKNKSYWKDNDGFFIFTPDGKVHAYRIFAVVNAKDGTSDYMYSFASDESFIEYVNRMKGKAVFPTDVKVKASDRIVTLSTCASVGSKKGKRVVVQGIEVYTGTAQEPASWYKEDQAYGTDEEARDKGIYESETYDGNDSVYD